MGAPGISGSLWRFGPFTMDGHSHELRREGLPIKLQDQPARILMFLLERPGEMISRDELQRSLWSSETFVDFDHSLNTAVMKLREALGDAADNPKYIETIPKRGYRFIAPVEPVGKLTELEPVVHDTKVVPQQHAVIRVAAVAVAMLAVLCGAIWFLRARPPAPVAPIERRLTANTAELEIRRAFISPDGKFLAYSDPTGMNLLHIESKEIRHLPLPENVSPYANGWFPDSTHLLISSMGAKGRYSLWKVSILGGSPQKLIDDAFGGSVSADGSRIAFLRGQAAHVGPEVWQMSSDGTDVTPLLIPSRSTHADDFSWDSFGPVAWSPDGTHFAAIHYVKSADRVSWLLETHAVKGGQSSVLAEAAVDDWSNPSVWWSRDGHIIYSLCDNPATGQCSVWSVAVNAATGAPSDAPRKLSSGTGFVTSLSATADSKHIAVLRANATTQAFIAEFDPATHVLRNHRRLTLDDRPSFPFDWAADSKTLIFMSIRRGTWDLFKQRIDQPTAEVVSPDRYDKHVPRVSPNGRWVYYERRYRDASKYDLMRVPLSGGPSELVFPLPLYYDPDFRCARAPATLCSIIFASRDGRFAVALFDGNTGAIVRELARVDARGADTGAAISPDAKLVAIHREGEHDGHVRLIRVADGTIRELHVKAWPVFRGMDWCADSKSFLTTAVSPKGDSVLLHVDLDGNARVLLTADNNAWFHYGIASPDGKHVAINETFGENNVWMIDNF